ncbi:hypothetical protein [Ralstonia chuxiongensis]|uniref:hypothetical protein n=1 Tax=Ralstonia chuxiongensis TaxID=2957504 RepID=UPI0029304BE1|nr:hypothetical protein [Ralstonia chuxiongensis]
MSALLEINFSRRRSANLFSYSQAAPHLILWGVLWIVGYGTSAVASTWSAPMWAILSLLGTLGDFALCRRSPNGYGLRFAAIALAILAFFVATFTVFAPVSAQQVGAFIPLVLAAIYVVMGLWSGTRLVIAGIVLGSLTVGGYLFLPNFFFTWMAAIGGGSLLLMGFWLRKV